MREKILITGGAGFIGSHLAELLQDDFEVIVLDNLATGYRKNLEGIRHTFFKGSINDYELVLRLMVGVRYVFHLAAMVSVPLSIQEPRKCLRDNVNGLLNVLDASVEHGVTKVILASSAAVYGNTEVSPKCECHLPAPESPYAITKLDGEHYLRMYHKTNGLSTTALRFFNVYGPRQDPESAYAAAVPIFVSRAMKVEPLTVFGDGEQTRDFVYVGDVVKGLLFAATASTLQGAYNLAAGHKTSINELISQIGHELGLTPKVEYAPVRAGDIRNSIASTAKLQEAGFQATTPLDVGIRSVINANRASC
ncbi:NAD-dependent epimerase/dehydratase family protein [bacterium]|nr:NAD-dependent epimerase/dehydratase family protein [bacterium]MDB4754133.1 NAD-dependent epimerase/dehydratase family protein [Akkermansiaceae bacterium]